MTGATDELARRLEERLRAQAGVSVHVLELRPLHGGACQDNFRVTLDVDGTTRHMALRSDAVRSLPASLGRREEFQVLQAAVRHGVPTPAARWLMADLMRPGGHAYLMDWVEGEALGRRVVKSSQLAGARARLPEQWADALAHIHAVTPAQEPALTFQNLPDVALLGAARSTLAFLRRMLDALHEPRPAVEFALRWLAERVPERTTLTLVHGDFRTGNFMVTPDGLSAVLDWEFAHWGDPMEDVAWLCVRDWRFGQLELAAGGVARRDVFYAAYARATGREVDRALVHFWEVMGNLRWALGSLYQGERYLSGEVQDIELVAVARRAVEMEWEALRLIEQGA